MRCPQCENGELFLKDEATYVYTYAIQEDGKVTWKDDDRYISYLFIDREQKNFNQIVQCNTCSKKFEYLIESSEDMDMVILKKSIHSNGQVSNHFMVQGKYL